MTFALVLVWAGFVLYGIANLRAGILPRRYGVAFVVALPVVVIFDLLVGALVMDLRLPVGVLVLSGYPPILAAINAALSLSPSPSQFSSDLPALLIRFTVR